ncbi:MAG: STAS domain-containing protein [Frankiaceae bacterium]
MALPSQTDNFVVRGPITRADLPGLTERVCTLLARTRETAQPSDVHPADFVHCDVADVSPDAPTVEALARLHLAAKRYGCRVRLCNASAELMDLVGLMGLGEVLIQ